MAPCLSSNNTTYGSSTHFKPSGKFYPFSIFRDIKTSNFFNKFIRQFVRWAEFSVAFRATSFINHITHIILMGPYEKMVWSYTRWVIALMTNKHSFWDWPIVHFPRNSMGRTDAISNLYSSIPSSYFSSRPNPASRSFIDIFPKTNSNWNFHRFRKTFATSFRSRICFPAAVGTLFGRMFSHLKVLLSGVMPPVMNVTRRFSYA